MQRSSFAQNLRVTGRVAVAFICFAALSSRLSAQDIASPSANAPTPAANPKTREVTDEAGRTIRIPQNLQRVISLAPSVTETLYSLGLQDRLVADTDYCDYPLEAKQKPHVGGPVNPSIETIASLHPDVVLVTKGLNRLDTVNSLSSLGIPSYTTDPHSVAEILTSAQHLADLMGATQAGDTLATQLRRELAETQRLVSPFPPKRVLFVVWTQPLISVGQETFIADALRYSGATSIVDEPQAWPQISLEEAASVQPDFLVFATSHTESTPINIDALAESPGWRIMTAVRNRRYAITTEAIERTSPRIVSAITDLAKQFHPEAFEKPGTTLPATAPPQTQLEHSSQRELLCAR